MSEPIHQHVDGTRLRTDIETTADFGALQSGEGRGRTVLPGTEPNRRARQYFVTRLEEAGLNVRIDPVGNVAGRWEPDGASTRADPVAAGSHLDSVVEGGIFDGVLGTYAALESVRAIQDAGVTPDRPIEIVSFTEEEGSRFSDGVLGSSVASGGLDAAEALVYEDESGITLGEALEDIGFRGTQTIDAATWDAWLELHVEQSTRLEEADVSTGIVTGITGTVRSHVDIVGEANHAGTTPMQNRRDALTAASELTLAVESIANDVVQATSETAVATVGQQTVEPNSINVIPGRVRLSIDIRDVRQESLSEMVTRIRKRIREIESARGVQISYTQPYEIAPSEMTARCIDQSRDAASLAGIDVLELHSGAGHDTMQIADVTDVGMLFARSIGGVSHSPHERTSWADCTQSTKVLAQTIWGLASSA